MPASCIFHVSLFKRNLIIPATVIVNNTKGKKLLLSRIIMMVHEASPGYCDVKCVRQIYLKLHLKLVFADNL